MRFARSSFRYLFASAPGILAPASAAIRYCSEFGIGPGIELSIFHSVSAFCNAGLDIIGKNSLSDYKTDPLVSLTVCGLIALGGLGFIVWWDVARIIKDKKKPTRLSGLLIFSCFDGNRNA